jgi:hypothetical protein
MKTVRLTDLNHVKLLLHLAVIALFTYFTVTGNYPGAGK